MEEPSTSSSSECPYSLKGGELSVLVIPMFGGSSMQMPCSARAEAERGFLGERDWPLISVRTGTRVRVCNLFLIHSESSSPHTRQNLLWGRRSPSSNFVPQISQKSAMIHNVKSCGGGDPCRSRQSPLSLITIIYVYSWGIYHCRVLSS